MVATTDSPVAKAARKRAIKAVAPEKGKATFHISQEAIRRLGVYAVLTGQTNSAVIESLIDSHLRRFVVSDRAKSADQAVLGTEEVSVV